MDAKTHMGMGRQTDYYNCTRADAPHMDRASEQRAREIERDREREVTKTSTRKKTKEDRGRGGGAKADKHTQSRAEEQSEG